MPPGNLPERIAKLLPFCPLGLIPPLERSIMSLREPKGRNKRRREGPFSGL